LLLDTGMTITTIDDSQLAHVTGGDGALASAGNWIKQRGYDLSEGASLAKASFGIDEFHPATPATFAKYNELRASHGRPTSPTPGAQ
jgi:hypothetical protein